VSFWNAAGDTRYPNGAGTEEEVCIACSGLDTALGVTQYANTYAPRAGQ